jgi:hypothetical protein
MWSLSSKIRKELVADQHPELGRRMAHAAAARGKGLAAASSADGGATGERL